MTQNANLWEERDLPSDLSLELHAGRHPALILAQADNAVWIELVLARHVLAALSDAAADLAELLAAGGVYHA